MGRKRLDDVLRGDRSSIRAALGREFDTSSTTSGDFKFGDDQPWRDDLPTSGSRRSDLDFDRKFSSKNMMGGFERCYNSHPPLKMPGTEFVIYGGSCSTPAVTDADVYVGFDGSMKQTQRAWPWKQGTEFLFRITDMSIPDNPAEFKKLVTWVRTQLEDGKKVHVGCIGGHGRTGTFLAALVSTYGEKDAIGYVRKNYCQKAVEATSQIKFLMEHFDVLEAKGSKSSPVHRSSKRDPYASTYYGTKYPDDKPKKGSKKAPAKGGAKLTSVHPIGNNSIWD